MNGDDSYPDMNAIRERASIALYEPIEHVPDLRHGDGFSVELDFLGETFVYHEGDRSVRGTIGRRYGTTVEANSVIHWLPGGQPINEDERSLIVRRVKQLALGAP